MLEPFPSSYFHIYKQTQKHCKRLRPHYDGKLTCCMSLEIYTYGTQIDYNLRKDANVLNLAKAKNY